MTSCLRARRAPRSSLVASTTRGVLGSGSGNGHRPHAGHDREGQRRGRPAVEAGDTVVILEAMKMENSVNAEKFGRREIDQRRDRRRR